MKIQWIKMKAWLTYSNAFFFQLVQFNMLFVSKTFDIILLPY